MTFLKEGETVSDRTKPLSGYTILDLTWVYSGPYCTSMLLDFGADVIKIEGPKRGDHSRDFPPFKNGVSGYYYGINRGKRSIALNLKSEKGKALFLEMVKKADMVVENFVPGVMEKMGLGYDVLKEINPRLIYGSVYGFGSWGPYAKMRGLDSVAQAMGGLMSLTGYPGMPPLKTGPAVADAVCGMYLCIGLLAAALEREKTGEGKRVEVGMMDAVFSVLEDCVVRASLEGKAFPPRGNTDPLGAPWDAYETCDGRWVMLCSMGGASFEKIYRAIGRDDIADEFSGEGEDAIARRSAARDEHNAALAEWAKQHTVDELIRIAEEARISCGPVMTIPELLEDPHLKAREMVVDIKHPRMGDIKTFNNPIMFDEHSVGIAPGENPLEPEIGEHDAEVLQQLLGLSEEEVARLREEGVLWAGV